MTTKLTIDEATAKELQGRFHVQLQTLSYDLGGSLADMVEACLNAALREMREE